MAGKPPRALDHHLFGARRRIIRCSDLSARARSQQARHPAKHRVLGGCWVGMGVGGAPLSADGSTGDNLFDQFSANAAHTRGAVRWARGHASPTKRRRRDRRRSTGRCHFRLPLFTIRTYWRWRTPTKTEESVSPQSTVRIAERCAHPGRIRGSRSTLFILPGARGDGRCRIADARGGPSTRRPDTDTRARHLTRHRPPPHVGRRRSVRVAPRSGSSPCHGRTYTYS